MNLLVKRGTTGMVSPGQCSRRGGPCQLRSRGAFQPFGCVVEGGAVAACPCRRAHLLVMPWAPSGQRELTCGTQTPSTAGGRLPWLWCSKASLLYC
uniref:Uncharacterized protein n=1 Tax=Triticum urartu TaxID=4572 RepID=A0A8R7PWE9_TRIUA